MTNQVSQNGFLKILRPIRSISPLGPFRPCIPYQHLSKKPAKEVFGHLEKGQAGGGANAEVAQEVGSVQQPGTPRDSQKASSGTGRIVTFCGC